MTSCSTLHQVLLHVTNYADKYGQEEDDAAKRAVNLKGEQDDEEWSEGEDEPLPDKELKGHQMPLAAQCRCHRCFAAAFRVGQSAALLYRMLG